MSPEQIAAITRSFQHLLLSEDTFAALFYRRLFTLDPALMPLFGADMQAQGRTFCRMLHYLAVRLPDSGQLCRDLHELGRRHRNYGVRAEQYVTFGAALHWALQQVLNERYTADVKQAWASFYLLLATTMQQDVAT